MVRFFAILGATVACAIPVHAVDVTLQYESPADAFFTPSARATLQRAASDVSQAITTRLSALNQSSYTGTSGASRITAEWSFLYAAPDTGAPAPDITNFNFLQDEFRVIVGRRPLAGNTLGRGGPAGAAISLNGSGNESTWASAMADLETRSNASMSRGGPLVGQFERNFDFSPQAPAAYELGYGFSLGSLTFDDMANWHFDFATLPGPGQNDFYSVAVHEILHTVGYGASRAWDLQRSGADWFGPEAIALLGTGVGVLDPDGDHLVSGTMGHPIIDGIYRTDLDQEAVMDPTLLTGSRKYLTDVDLAFLSDMGWDVMDFAAVPEPSTILLLLLAGTTVAIRRARPFR
ncbi:MAG: PEP-CTERM sorting domain-containing protein [Chthoniobacterales bacterium]